MCVSEIQNFIVSGLSHYLSEIVISCVVLVTGYISIKIILRLIHRIFVRAKIDKGVVSFLESSARVVLWLIVLVIVLGIWGIDATGIIAGLGVAGLIIGLALKDSLSNLASGLFILFYKPFKVGDLVNIGGTDGIVEEIGIAFCTLKGENDTKVIIPNSKVWGNKILNYGTKQSKN